MAPTAVTLQPPPGADQARQHPREFALAQAASKAGELASVPRQALEGVVHKYGQDGSAPGLPDKLPFDKLAVSLHRGCTHPHAQGQGDCLGLAAHDKGGQLTPVRFPRRALKPNDVRLSIAFCGICHSDLHKIRSEWGPTHYPCVPGHEIVGIVTEVGDKVSAFAPGDKAAVGCMVGSCGECGDCAAGLQQYCAAGPGPVWTYDSEDPEEGGAITRGGYSTHIVLHERFALHLPPNLPMAAAAPLLCAGITTYSPLRHFGLDKPGMHVGVVGLGGLGHMAVKLAKAFGCEVSVISTSPSKRDEALGRLGADKFVVSKSEEDMRAAAGTLDGIIDTVSAPHDLVSYLSLLRTDGKLVLVGLPPEPLKVPAFALTSRRRSVTGSGIGSIEETQEMLDFCGEKGITCDIELIQADYVNTAMERLEKNDVKYRFVIDVQGSLTTAAMQAAATRMAKELRMLQTDPPPGVWAAPLGDSAMQLEAQLQGPKDTVYEGGIFKLAVDIPARYPFEPPKVRFVTKVYHPNIDPEGRICLDLLNMPPKGAWKPSLNVGTVLASLGLLLAEPNPDDGLVADTTAEFRHQRAVFDAKARQWTRQYAVQPPGGGGGAEAAAAADEGGEGGAAAQKRQQEHQQQQEQQQQQPAATADKENGQPAAPAAGKEAAGAAGGEGAAAPAPAPAAQQPAKRPRLALRK